MSPAPPKRKKKARVAARPSKTLCKQVLRSLRRTATASNSLPEAADLELVTAVYPSTSSSVRLTSRRVRDAIASAASRYTGPITDTETGSGLGSGSDSDTAPASATNDALFERVREATDEALEKFNAALDEARGIRDAAPEERGAIGPEERIGLGRKRQCNWVDMEKPQMRFPDWPVDNSDTAFLPPCAGGRGKAGGVDEYLRQLYQTNSKTVGDGGGGGRHPYEEEIVGVAERMGRSAFRKEETIVYRAMEKTPCVFITTEEELFEAAERLKRAREVAIDLENHSVRSFQGFTCLIQLSTRKEDFVVDALALRGCVNRALAPVFADEGIVKVLHGADKDVQWLERDFGVYVVNMFDTGQAARLLKFPSAALSYLQARFCDVTETSKKKFQLSDWRQRPLPQDMFQYARSDTHYLLYIYDRLRAQLAEKGLTAKAWERSAVVARKRYSKIRYDAGMPRHLCAKYGLGFNPHQIRLLEELYRWRDRKAREEDESLNYVAPLGTLFGIIRAGDKVRTVEGLLKHGFPVKSVPPLMKEHADEIVRLVVDSLDAKLHDLENVSKAHPKPLESSVEDHLGKKNSAEVVIHEENAKEKRPETNSSRTMPPASNQRAKIIVKASFLSKSRLYESDSSDSDTDQEPNHPTNTGDHSISASHAGSNAPQRATEHDFASGAEKSTEQLTECNLKHSPVENVRTMAKATTSKESVFHLSDTENSSDEDETPLVSTDCAKQQTVVGDIQKALTEANDDVLSEDRQDTKPSQVCRTGSLVLLTEKSVFKFSDEDTEDEGSKAICTTLKSNLARDSIARSHSSMQGFIPKCIDGFRVESDPVPGEELTPEPEESHSSSRKRRRYEEELLNQDTPMSIEDSYRLLNNKKKGKKDKKRKKREAIAQAAPVLPAFNYTYALREERNKRKQEQAAKGEPFDAMEKLRLNSKHGGKFQKRPRKPKKSPASGSKSMSFPRQ